MGTTVQQTWKPTTAGILNIITGAISALEAIILIIILATIDIWLFLYDSVPAENLPIAATILNTLLIGSLILSISHTIFPIIGGVFAIRRKRWGWSLAGSIIAILAILPLGVASTIFVAMARDEFN